MTDTAAERAVRVLLGVLTVFLMADQLSEGRLMDWCRRAFSRLLERPRAAARSWAPGTDAVLSEARQITKDGATDRGARS